MRATNYLLCGGGLPVERLQELPGVVGERTVFDGLAGGRGGPFPLPVVVEPPAELPVRLLRAGERRQGRQRLVALTAWIAEEEQPARGHLHLPGSHRPAGLQFRVGGFATVDVDPATSGAVQRDRVDVVNALLNLMPHELAEW